MSNNNARGFEGIINVSHIKQAGSIVMTSSCVYHEKLSDLKTM